MLIDVNTLRGLVADLGVEAFETLMNLFREDAGLTVQKLEHIFVRTCMNLISHYVSEERKQ